MTNCTEILTGHCACCGNETKSLFAMGHDARFRGFLARELAVGGWDATLSWFTTATEFHSVTITEALTAIKCLIDRDWLEKVEKSASRISKTPLSSAARRPKGLTTASEGPRTPLAPQARPFVPRDVATERIDALIDQLQGRPLTGQWGWYRPADDPDTRYAARVQKTRRDSEDSSLIDLFIPAAQADVLTQFIVERVDPRCWIRDEGAREAS